MREDLTVPSLLRSFLLGLILCLPLAASDPAIGQAQPAPTPTASELLDDFRHYVITRQDTLARASAQALIDLALSPEEFVGIVEDSRFGEDGFEQSVRRGLFISTVEAVAAQLQALYEQGRRDKARNPDEIARNINLLAGGQRGRILATQRLIAAGEYAAPQLLQVLTAKRSPALEAEAERVLIALGADAVAPLSAALLETDPATQERLSVILGLTRHPSALAPLHELAATTANPASRAAAQRAIERIAGEYNPNLALADLYRLLAEDYFAHSQSLTRFPGEPHQLAWNFDPSLGLFPTPIRSEVFHETRAMQLAEKSLSLDAANEAAVSLWIAANIKREIDSPEGYENPVYGSDRRDALYYAVASGAGTMQDVLARALASRDTPLARRAIEALRVSAGGAGIWSGRTGVRALLDALTYPDRRVRYEAALAIGAANPSEPFDGAERVTPLLASAIRDAEARFAVVIARDPEIQQTWASLLRAEGYEVLPPSGSLADAAPAIAEAPGIDLIIIQTGTADAEGAINAARDDARLRATPILAVLPVSGWYELRFRYQNNPLTDVRREGLDSEQLAESVRALTLAASGPAITADQARRYALDALGVLRDLSISGSASLSVSDASGPLIAALGSTEGDVRLQVADVLARIGQKRSQVALMEAALDAAGAEQVALLDKVTRSAKTFGNMLESRHVRRLFELTEAPENSVATAAAALMGALNLRGGEIRDLILVTR